MSKNSDINSAGEFNSLSSKDSLADTAQITSNRFETRRSDDAHSSPTAVPEKRRRGAPQGNQNAFGSGASLLERAVRRPPGRVQTRARRISGRVTCGLIESLGGERQISEQVRIICGITGNQCGRYDRATRAYEAILRKGGDRIRKNLVSLGKLDAVLRPLEDSITRNLQKLGLEKICKA